MSSYLIQDKVNDILANYNVGHVKLHIWLVLIWSDSITVTDRGRLNITTLWKSRGKTTTWICFGPLLMFQAIKSLYVNIYPL